MAINRAASSTMGTLLATALMRAGKEIKGCTELDEQNLVTMLQAADTGIQERGKAKPGDKTIVDALHPAAVAFSEALGAGAGLPEAAAKMIAAAEAGRDSATPLRSRIGRASWQGERTEGQVDPGCAATVIMLKALAGQWGRAGRFAAACSVLLDQPFAIGVTMPFRSRSPRFLSGRPSREIFRIPNSECNPV
jgi:dihydroxyacetone kinase